ncbi:DUF4272 domain-containing protein [Blastopirellula retiformator]|uniref:DUF4272 domain-containing protein n=1 Tax=Blastopirellula retiformator TaxID=2527970 RepID=A0A5C5VLF6_9BACT|nr:DUF4272 domain-containing protein [Blastopirellula retiformator]TWT38893.1 hypothetical protein Enr8_05870 [Blastopirellula retiformator]
MTTTKQFAIAHKVWSEEVVPAIPDCEEALPETAVEIARRILILHGVAAVGYGVDGGEVFEWLDSQGLTGDISPWELALLKADEPSERNCSIAVWRPEAAWALLWTIGKITTLGLPTKTCDTAKLVDELIPPLGGSIDAFVQSAQLRPAGEILAEHDRHYNLHCYVRQAVKGRSPLPRDLQYPVLWQRCYAFEWIYDADHWDDVTVDT